MNPRFSSFFKFVVTVVREHCFAWLISPMVRSIQGAPRSMKRNRSRTANIPISQLLSENVVGSGTLAKSQKGSSSCVNCAGSPSSKTWNWAFIVRLLFTRDGDVWRRSRSVRIVDVSLGREARNACLSNEKRHWEALTSPSGVFGTRPEGLGSYRVRADE